MAKRMSRFCNWKITIFYFSWCAKKHKNFLHVDCGVGAHVKSILVLMLSRLLKKEKCHFRCCHHYLNYMTSRIHSLYVCMGFMAQITVRTELKTSFSQYGAALVYILLMKLLGWRGVFIDFYIIAALQLNFIILHCHF